MTNIYATQGLRGEHQISWAEEYILGLVGARPDISTSAVMVIAKEAMSPNTAFKYTTALVKRGYLEQYEIDDKRYLLLRLTDKGEHFLNEMRKYHAP